MKIYLSCVSSSFDVSEVTSDFFYEKNYGLIFMDCLREVPEHFSLHFETNKPITQDEENEEPCPGTSLLK